jgi:tRNA A-37 threonylcarbamoyl transferase component Bud32
MLLSVAGKDNLLFAKRYKCRGIADKVKYFFIPSKVSVEWKTMHALLDRGIPVARPLAKGEHRRYHVLQDSYLFTQALVHALPLRAYITQMQDQSDSSEAFRSRREIISAVARVVSAIHEEGFFYRDLHAGNILVDTSDDDTPVIYPIDFHKVWHFSKMPVWMRVRDLAQLKNSLSSSASDQWQFLKEYTMESPSLKIPLKEFACQVNKKAAHLWRVHLRSRTKRCLVESSEFAVRKGNQMSLYYRKTYSEDQIRAIVKQYDTGSLSSHRTILKETLKEIVSSVTVCSQDGSCKRFFIKESRLTGLFNSIVRTFTCSRSKRSWVAARGLQVRGMKTPLPIALIEEKRLGLLKRTIVITEFLDDAYELNDYVLRCFGTKGNLYKDKSKECFIAALAHQLKKMHSQGIYHADLKSNNIVVTEKGEHSWNFFFVDLDRVVFTRKLSFEQMANNLAQINASIADCISPADRLKFFRIYSEGTPQRLQRKRYFKRIVEIGRQKNTRPYGVIFTSSTNTSL